MDINDIVKIEDLQKLEDQGKNLLLMQVMELLNYFADAPVDQIGKWERLFFKLPSQVFSELLLHLNEKQKKFLKAHPESVALKHQLVTLVHELGTVFNRLVADEEQLERDLISLNPQELNQQDLAAWKMSIEKLKSSAENNYLYIKPALELSWGTLAEELVLQLSVLKEKYIKFLLLEIGDSQSDTGLFKILEETVFAPYQEAGLSDASSSTEGLAALGIISSEDYRELGLEIAESIEQSLNRINLSTVADLKKNNIFSKKSFVDYLVGLNS